MKTYEFTLILSDVDDDAAEAIYAKCTGASLGKCNETTYVAFDRESESLECAIHSAIADLRSIGVQPLRVEIEVAASTW